MNDQTELRERANLTVQKYFEDCDRWPTSVLINQLETLAYEIAREGDNNEATGLFVLVADMSLASNERLHKTDCRSVFTHGEPLPRRVS